MAAIRRRYGPPDLARLPSPVPVTGSVAIMHNAAAVHAAERRNVEIASGENTRQKHDDDRADRRRNDLR